MIINILTGGSLGPSFGQPDGAGAGAGTNTAPTITTASLPAATVGVAYSAQLDATGTPSSFTWLVTSGNLPSWLTLSTGGLLSGTPAAGDVTAGINLGFSCSNGVLPNGTVTLSLVVGAAATGLPQITSGFITEATKNVAYSYQLTSINNPTVFTIVTPDIVMGDATSVGLSAYAPAVRMQSTGSNYAAGTTATFSAPAAGGITAKGYPYIVGGAIQAVVITDPGKGYLSAPTVTFGNVGLGAGAAIQAPVMGSHLNGTFLQNISLNRSTGLLSGTETAGGAFQFGIMAFNSIGGYLGVWGFKVNPVPPYIIEDDTFFAVVGDQYSQQFTTTGSTPITWSSAGSLPAGLAFDTANGTITGTATASSTTTFTVTATNAESSHSKNYFVVAYDKVASRIHSSDLTYIGSFRVPKTGELEFAGSNGRGCGITLSNKPGSFGNGTMYIAGRDLTNATFPVAEINIPALVDGYTSGSLSALNTATFAQPWTDSISGSRPTFNNKAEICAIKWEAGKLYISATYFYDTLASTHKTFSRSDVLSTTTGYFGPAGITDSSGGFRKYMGYLTQVPSRAQTAYGISSMLIGGTIGSIDGSKSQGPSALIFNPSSLNSTTTVVGQKALLYPFTSAPEKKYSKSLSYLFGQPDIPNLLPYMQHKWWNTDSTQISGAAWVSSTNKRSFLTFGRNAIGKTWYGAYERNELSGASIRTGGAFNAGASLDDRPGLVYDPLFAQNKGVHGYPYRLVVTAYDESEMADVLAGTKDSWLAKPYDAWVLQYPFFSVGSPNDVHGVAHDEINRKIYVSVASQDATTSGSVPIIHVYQYQA